MYREIIRPRNQRYIIQIPSSSMQQAWNNSEDEAWDELKMLFCKSIF